MLNSIDTKKTSEIINGNVDGLKFIIKKGKTTSETKPFLTTEYMAVQIVSPSKIWLKANLESGKEQKAVPMSENGMKNIPIYGYSELYFSVEKPLNYDVKIIVYL